MSFWSRPRNIALIGGGLAALFIIPNPFKKSPNPFQTPGVDNISERFSSGGATDVHTPGVATPRGDSANMTERQTNPSGIRSEQFKESQTDQKLGKPGPLGKAWNEAHYGTEKGK